MHFKSTLKTYTFIFSMLLRSCTITRSSSRFPSVVAFVFPSIPSTANTAIGISSSNNNNNRWKISGTSFLSQHQRTDLNNWKPFVSTRTLSRDDSLSKLNIIKSRKKNKDYINNDYEVNDESDEFLEWPSSSLSSTDNQVPVDGDSPSSSLLFALDPESPKSKDFFIQKLNIDPTHYEKLVHLAHLVVEWNTKINLISRKECTLDIVLGRHILPSVALKALPDFPTTETQQPIKIIDVGTGGGFPGVPLAIIFPEYQFMLVDSVGKKLKAIEEMVKVLGLRNVKTHHGRAEEMIQDKSMSEHYQAYDICVGRSVTALPRFCFWIQDLLNAKSGKLIYITGGEIESYVQSRVKSDVPINDLVQLDSIGSSTENGTAITSHKDSITISDKRALVFQSQDVLSIAKMSGETKKVIGGGASSRRSNNNNNSNSFSSNSNTKNKNPKGAWTKRDNSVKKDRGYENFKRYEA